MTRAFLAAAASLTLAACAVDEGDAGESESRVVTGPKSCGDASATGKCLLKVLTINLRHDADDWGRRRPMVIEEVNRLAPDLIGLQELRINHEQGDEITDGLEIDYERYEHRKMGLIGWWRGEGIGIYSRFPMKEKDVIDLGERRLAMRALVELPSGRRLDMYNTHLHNTGGDEIRLPQAEKVTSWMAKSQETRFVLTGDFNATDTSLAVKHVVSSGYLDSFKALYAADTNARGATFPAPLTEGAELRPTRRIDFVFSRGALRPVASEIVLKNCDARGFCPSDHLAVMTTYEVTL